MDVLNILTLTLDIFGLAEMLFRAIIEFFPIFEKNVENLEGFTFSKIVSQLQYDLQPQEVVIYKAFLESFWPK